MLKSCNYNNYINIAHMHVCIIDAHLRSHTHSMLVHVYINMHAILYLHVPGYSCFKVSSVIMIVIIKTLCDNNSSRYKVWPLQ